MPFVIRHQCVGVVHEFVFADMPTELQIAAVARFVAPRCAHEVHPKTGEPWRVWAEPRELIGDSIPTIHTQEPNNMPGPQAPTMHGIASAGET